MTSTWLRGAGGVLEIIGVLTIAFELRGIRKLYPREGRGFLGRLWDRMPWRKREVKAVAAGGAIGVGTAFGADVQTWSDAWDSPRKIDELRDRIERLRERTDEADKQIREQADRDRREFAEQLDGVSTELRDLDAKVGKLTKGSIRIRGWGVLPLILGIVLTTWPTEIAGWFGAS